MCEVRCIAAACVNQRRKQCVWWNHLLVHCLFEIPPYIIPMRVLQTRIHFKLDSQIILMGRGHIRYTFMILLKVSFSNIQFCVGFFFIINAILYANSWIWAPTQAEPKEQNRSRKKGIHLGAVANLYLECHFRRLGTFRSPYSSAWNVLNHNNRRSIKTHSFPRNLILIQYDFYIIE